MSQNAAATTAIGPTVIVAIDQYADPPLLVDPVAARLLPGSARALVGLARWRPVRAFVFGMTERRIPGLWAETLCRKRYIDDQLSAAIGSGAEAVVILGAGLDTRAYRLPVVRGLAVYEVDLPANLERKQRRLYDVLGAPSEGVAFVPDDLENKDLSAVLGRAGFSTDVRTCFVWEAVTQYLTEAGVRSVCDFLAAAAPGSRLVFTYIRQDFLDGRAVDGAEAAYQDFVVKRRLWKFGIEPDEVPAFLAPYGWRVLEQVGGQELRDRYVRPSGRRLDVAGLERAVVAEKT